MPRVLRCAEDKELNPCDLHLCSRKRQTLPHEVLL